MSGLRRCVISWNGDYICPYAQSIAACMFVSKPQLRINPVSNTDFEKENKPNAALRLVERKGLGERVDIYV